MIFTLPLQQNHAAMLWKQFVPIFNWLPKYNNELLRGDISAGLTVGVMLIPQGMAYAMIAGLPPIYGLYASTVPLLLYAVFGTSRQLAVGPVAMVSLLTAAGVGTLAETGTEVYITLAIMLALLVGLIQFTLGAFRLGFLVNFLSHPVISGFTFASALIIGLSQLKHLLGINLDRSHYVHEIIIQAIAEAGNIHWITVLIGLGGIFIIKGIKRLNPAIPGPLSAVVFGILVVWIFGLTDQGVKIVGEVPKGLPSWTLPSVHFAQIQTLVPIALAISLVSFMESIAVAKAIQAKHKNYKVEPNQELIALGIANIGGAFFQSYPTTGGFSRTAVNDQAGAKTGMASIFSAFFIVLNLFFLTPLFYFLPNAILASVIMVAVFGLIDVKEALHLWYSDRSDFMMLMVTFAATLALGIEQGIGVGVVLSLAMVIYRSTKPHTAELGRIPGSDLYRNVERFTNLEIRPELLIFRFDAQLYFANVQYFKDSLEEMVAKKGKNLKAILINAASINGLDSSAAHALEEVINEYKGQGIKTYFSGVRGPVRDALNRAGLIEKIGEQNFFMNVEQAVQHIEADGKLSPNGVYKDYALQTNK